MRPHEAQTPLRLNTLFTSFGAMLAAFSMWLAPAAFAQQHHSNHATSPPSPFIADTSKSFQQLMDDAMRVMDYDMHDAPVSGKPNVDFINMMIPHHQGAIDMAKALLLYTNDPELRNLAQGIITEQQNEIRLMQAWRSRHSPCDSNANADCKKSSSTR